VADIDGSLNFITGEYPKLDTCLLDIVDGLANLILQLVLDGRRTDQIELNFKYFCDLVDRCFLID